jgi:hypothetical protein
MSTQVQWLAPSPLWPPLTAGADRTAFRAPALLRFSTDTFMADLQTLLANAPANLASYVAQPETWRSPAVGLATTPSLAASTGTASSNSNSDQAPATLKLFQPVHARFYLVTASLVCRLPVLPDHTVKTNQGEKTTFVLRRLQLKANVAADLAGSPFDPQIYDEYAWIPNASSSGGASQPGWAPADANSVVPGEDKLPLFATTFGSNGAQRRIFAGVIPAGRKQAYAGAVALTQTTGGQASAANPDPRAIDFQQQVLDPWGNLATWGASAADIAANQGSSSASADSISAAQSSAFILVDFANFLAANLPEVWAVVQGTAASSTLSGAQLALYNAISGATMGDIADANRPTLAAVIALAKTFENDLNNEILPSSQSLSNPPTAAQLLPSLPAGYPGPLLCDLSDPQLASLIGSASDLDPLPKRLIETLVEAALNQAGPAPASVVPPPANNPLNPQGDDWYMVRCVYDRPQCTVPPLQPIPVMSPASQVFQLASYFDPDAPARRIQVALPIDTTAAALRKYDKGVAFMISDQLNQQMQRVTGLQDLMNGQVGAPGSGFNLGMICSFSIPIITICAMIVLMIFVILLNIVFFWLPFLKICFPLPSFSAKGGD